MQKTKEHYLINVVWIKPSQIFRYSMFKGVSNWTTLHDLNNELLNKSKILFLIVK